MTQIVRYDLLKCLIESEYVSLEAKRKLLEAFEKMLKMFKEPTDFLSPSDNAEMSQCHNFELELDKGKIPREDQLKIVNRCPWLWSKISPLDIDDLSDAFQQDYWQLLKKVAKMKRIKAIDPSLLFDCLNAEDFKAADFLVANVTFTGDPMTYVIEHSWDAILQFRLEDNILLNPKIIHWLAAHFSPRTERLTPKAMNMLWENLLNYSWLQGYSPEVARWLLKYYAITSKDVKVSTVINSNELLSLLFDMELANPKDVRFLKATLMEIRRDVERFYEEGTFAQAFDNYSDWIARGSNLDEMPEYSDSMRILRMIIERGGYTQDQVAPIVLSILDQEAISSATRAMFGD